MELLQILSEKNIELVLNDWAYSHLSFHEPIGEGNLQDQLNFIDMSIERYPQINNLRLAIRNDEILYKENFSHKYIESVKKLSIIIYLDLFKDTKILIGHILSQLEDILKKGISCQKIAICFYNTVDSYFPLFQATKKGEVTKFKCMRMVLSKI